MQPLRIAARQLVRQCASKRASFCPACSSVASQAIPSAARPAALQTAQWQQIRLASKKKSSGKKGAQKKGAKDDDDEIEVENFPVPVVAKGKKAKAAQVTEADDIEAFHLDELAKDMDKAIERLQRDLRTVVGRVERLSPALLDGVRVEEHGQRFPLQNYATVSVHGSEALSVNIFDPAYVKPVEKALRQKTDLSLNPQRVDDLTLRVPIPRPDMKIREELVRKASELTENCRIAIRAVRHQGQKDLKADQDNKVVGEADARKDAKHLQDATKKRTDEADRIFAQAKKVLLDE